MARISMSDLNVTAEQLTKLGRPMIRKIVEAGAGAAAKVEQEIITRRGHVRTGDLVNSVGAGAYQEWLDGGAQEVYPQGENRNGQRLQTIAYVINYGRGGSRRNRDGSRSRMGDKFMKEVEAQGEEAAMKAMEAESDRLMTEAGAE